MAYVLISSLETVVKEVLISFGVPAEQAAIITDTVAYAHSHEKHTHGITRIPIYEKKINNNLMTAETQVIKALELPAVTVFDCQNGFGQIAAYKAMEESINKAKINGIGAAFVRNSNNFGVAGYFGEIAANENMVGIVITSSGPAIAPEGGNKPIFGTNPICCAFPTSEGNVVLDMAVSASARGKIRLAKINGEKIPFGWAVDKEGNPTDDPDKALEGNMLAIGGVKGFGLAMVIDMLAGLLSGSAFGGNIKPLGAEDGYSRHGHMMMAIDIKQLLDLNEYEEKITEFIKNIKSCGAPGKIFLPGEQSRIKAAENSEKVELKDKQIDDLKLLAERLGVTERLEIVEK